MLWKSIGCDICFETFVEKAEICSCMYMRNVSLDQRPIFLIVLCGMPCRCIAIAPPARRLWLPTWLRWRPFRSNPKSATDDLTAVLMSAAVSARPVGYLVVKYVPSIVFWSVVWDWMCLMRRMMAFIGQVLSNVASWWITWLRFSVFLVWDAKGCGCAVHVKVWNG